MHNYMVTYTPFFMYQFHVFTERLALIRATEITEEQEARLAR